MKIIKSNFELNNYYQKEVEKKQIVLHHTVSSDNVNGVMDWWNQEYTKSGDKVAVCYIISHDGTIYQLFNSPLHWAYHLGLSTKFLQSKGFGDSSRSFLLNQTSIGIELTNWGPLLPNNGNFYPIMNSGSGYLPNTKLRPLADVTTLETQFRGFKYFESYTEQQIQAVQELVTYLGKTYNIPLTYNDNKWDVCNDALAGNSGLFYHVSYRPAPEKTDLFPDPNMISMLKNLK
jgi:N-acetyl-anhydromuramyl-L-alanine amidase AmpD